MIDLTQFQELVVQQEIELLEVFTGFETGNRYSILTVDGEQVVAPATIRRKELFLVPLGLPGMSIVDVEVSNGKQSQLLRVTLGSQP